MEQLPLIKPKRKSPESVRRLSPKETYLLATLVAEEYAQSKKDDVEFALYACAKLGISGINRNHVATSREIHEIPSFKTVRALANSAVVVNNAELESRVLSLERQVRKLFALSDEKPSDVSYQHEEPTEEQAFQLWMRLYEQHNYPTGAARAQAFALAILRGAWK